jgi:glycosyltransferase involved in cell wall biosynthesis
VFYNARNIRRKSTSDLIAAYVEFCNSIGKDKAKKTALLLHTQAMDENGTDLNAVIEAIADPSIHRIVINDERLSTDQMNLLYNMCDVTALISSNEGWGLSLTEAMMAGKMIIANTTGGMQDQMRFEDENGKWIEFSEEFPSNHFGRYRKHGEWAVPVFPSNISILGSIPTPYIYDDRCSFKDVARAIEQVYSLDAQERNHRGLSAREWVTSDEAMMSARWMCKNVITNVDTTLQSWKPRKNFELLKVEDLPRKKVPHTLTY